MKVYGFLWPPGHQQTFYIMAFIATIRNFSSLPWVCMGDFNEITSLDEKEGGRIRPLRQINEFVSALEDWWVSDLGFVGNKFTWDNKHEDSSWTRLRLDRGAANSWWRALFPSAKVVHLFSEASDHLPIILDWVGSSMGGVCPNNCRRRRIFQFEQKWVKMDECKTLIESTWAKPISAGLRNNESLGKLKESLSDTASALSNWAKSHPI